MRTPVYTPASSAQKCPSPVLQCESCEQQHPSSWLVIMLPDQPLVKPLLLV
jgi:hypothetical protein